MNWNIFLSTLTQTTATIVAIWGAFIISKILRNETTYKNNIAEIRSAWNISYTLEMRSLMNNYEGYNKSSRYAALQKLKEMVINDVDLSADEYYFKLDFSWYDKREDILNLLNQVLGKRESKESIISRIDDELKILHDYNYSDYQRISIKSDIQKQYIEVYDNSNKVFFLLKTLKGNPEYSKIIQWSLIILSLLFCVGVIFPLSLIPINSNINFSINGLFKTFSITNITKIFSLKSLIISLVSIPYFFLLVYFFIINSCLKYKPENINMIKDYINAEHYNIYFKCFQENSKYYWESVNDKNK